MNVMIFILVFLYVSGNEAEDFPLLNSGDIHLENLTDSSVVLTWKLKDKQESNITDTPRLVIHMETESKPPIYMTPDYDDKQCSISISRCQLSFLTHSTSYTITVTVDDIKRSILLGHAIVRFTTHSVEDKHRLLKKILLYVVLPGVIGFIIIIVTLVIVCAKCCHCLCWRKHQEILSVTSDLQHSLDVTSHQDVRVSNYYDEAYVSEASMQRQESSRYLPVLSGQQPFQPSYPFEMERHLSKDRSSSGETHVYLDDILAQQQLQHPPPPRNPPPHHHRHHHQQQHHHYHSPRGAERPSPAVARIDNDGYLDVVNPGVSDYYANGLNML